MRQLAGRTFTLVGGPSAGRRHILTEVDDSLLIYDIATAGQLAEHGETDAPVACFKAPQRMAAVRSHGAAICVGCDDGAVCILSAPFLSA